VEESNWVAVVPVKAPKRGKSRLGPELEHWRVELAAAFAADTLAALLDATQVKFVVVVGGQGLPASLLDHARVHTLPDPGSLNAAAADGIAWSRRHHPGSAILVLAADLPAATGAAVDRLLEAMPERGLWVLPDLESVGSTGLLIGSGSVIAPDFGEESLSRHRAAGASPIELRAIDGLRRDVDTADQLSEAIGLGVGRRTQAVLDAMGRLADVDRPLR
jgi:2-phospho-L-lactate/phosphoenolpyruvate guanylyltransferase